MYQITKKALSPDAQVENCVRVILDDFNWSPEKFNETTLPPAINVTASVTTHPYALIPKSINQVQIPNAVDTSYTDQHGQLKSSFLDQIFDYVLVQLSNGRIEYGGLPDFNLSLTPNLSEDLEEWLADRFQETDLFDAKYKYFKKCSTPFCKTYFEKLQTQIDDYFKQGLDITSLDTSIALIFGNKTSIGQVCSFVKGLRERTVVDVPGFCCLDAPYKSFDWGEKVR